MYLLDTNVISELRKPRPHGAVVAWLDAVADEDLRLSAMTLGELQAGVEITREHDPDKAAEIEIWIDRVAQTWNILPVDGRVFRTWTKLMDRRSGNHLVVVPRHDGHEKQLVLDTACSTEDGPVRGMAGPENSRSDSLSSIHTQQLF